jgi:hypothetical protein
MGMRWFGYDIGIVAKRTFVVPAGKLGLKNI